ncbi:kelch domain containing 4 [Mayamaea pseudoterrestris]|nr:kelch domain containing 4 [Mayamaea pseudoterrestris]
MSNQNPLYLHVQSKRRRRRRILIPVVSSMAKKKSKKADADKKATLQIKKEAKADKKAQKRLQKAAGDGLAASFDEADNAGATKLSALDALLQQYKQHDQKVVATTTIETMDGFPPPRSNASLTLYEDTKKKHAEVYMFGGEYFDGVENLVLDHLLKYDLQKQEWKRILTPVTPPARCAHSCVYYNHALYVFGGERCVAEEFYHYKDCWKFDIRAQAWEEVKPSRVGTLPTARSGHAAVVWKHFMICFGGFFEAMKEAPRWFNDVTVLDLQTLQWMDIPHSKLTMRPEPRSACNVAIVGDDKMIVHGGFSKLSKTSLKLASVTDDTDPATTETKVHTDSWILHLKPLLQSKPPTWERLTSSVAKTQLDHARNPCGRSGAGSVAYKERMLVYGGVVDKEQYDYKMDSVFYNDLNAFDIVRRKWFPVNARRLVAGQEKQRRRKDAAGEGASAAADGEQQTGDKHAEAPEDDSDGGNSELEEDEEENEGNRSIGWDVQKLRSNMFAFMDGEGNLVYEKINEKNVDAAACSARGEEKWGQEDEDSEEHEETKMDDPAQKQASRGSSATGKSVGFHTLTASSIMVVNPDTRVPEPAQQMEPLPRIKPAMFISGSVLYVYGGLLEVGDREVTLDDFWCFDLRKREQWVCIFAGSMHKQVWRGAVNDDEDSYYSASKGDDVEDELDDDLDESDDENDAVSNNSEDMSADVYKKTFMELDKQYGISDSSRTPQANESLAEFYSRTSGYWNDQVSQAAAPDATMSTKELKREGFALARTRFEELEPIWLRLGNLKLDSKHVS